jgi:hypothetical protein
MFFHSPLLVICGSRAEKSEITFVQVLICPYVHYRKYGEALQGHSGSCMSCDGTFGEIVWKGSVGVHDAGGTPKKAHVPHAPARHTPPQLRCCACGQHARTPTTAALGGRVLSLSRVSRPAAACRPYATRVARPAGCASSHTPTAGDSAHRPLAAMRPHPTAGNARTRPLGAERPQPTGGAAGRSRPSLLAASAATPTRAAPRHYQGHL